jgi:hypothetical protein
MICIYIYNYLYNYFFVVKLPQIKPIKRIIKKIKPISSTESTISVSQIIVIEPIQIIETVALLLQQPQLEPIIENNNTLSPFVSSSSSSNSPTPSPTYTYPFSIINYKNHKKYTPTKLEIIYVIQRKITHYCNDHNRTKKPSLKLILRLSNENRIAIPIITYLEELNSFRNESLTESISDKNERDLEKILNKIFEEIYDDYENNPEPVSPL